LPTGAGALFFGAVAGFAGFGFGATFCFDSPVFLAAAAGLVAFFPADGVLTVFGAQEKSIALSIIGFVFVDRAIRRGSGVK
jgi:hypothetical protein